MTLIGVATSQHRSMGRIICSLKTQMERLREFVNTVIVFDTIKYR